MTREEAIRHLYTYSTTMGSGQTSDEQHKEAKRMAIEALQANTDGDLISRQDALKPFCIAPDGTRIPEVDCDNFPVEFSVEFIKKHLLSLPSAEPKTGEWIPCSERLPKRDELVLVTYKTTDRIHLCRYLDDGSENPWWSYIDDCCAWNNVVLAWMPLPKPYKGGDDE